MSAIVQFQHRCDQCTHEPVTCLCGPHKEQIAQTIAKQQQRITELEERLLTFFKAPSKKVPRER